VIFRFSKINEVIFGTQATPQPANFSKRLSANPKGEAVLLQCKDRSDDFFPLEIPIRFKQCHRRIMALQAVMPSLN